MRAMVVADRTAGRQALCRLIRSNGHQVERADTGEDALDLVRRYEFDIIVLHLGLSGPGGMDVIRHMRAGLVNVPILALSPTPHSRARTAALASGADDVVALPFDEAELEARMRAILRRSRGFSHRVLTAGTVSLDTESREVCVAGRPVHLTAKETAILELLMLRRNTALSKDVFLSQLYASADQEPEAKIVDVFVCKVRKKLADAGAPGLIETVWGRGYTIRDINQKAVPRTTPDKAPAPAPTRPVREMA